MLRARAALGGMVTAPHHLAAQAGLAVLNERGNAIEAAVAAAAACAVVYPHMNAIGGDGFWLIAAPGETPIAIDASGPAAALATPERYQEGGQSTIPTRGGAAALTVAGAVAGWSAALEVARQRGGSLPIDRLLEDPIRHARDGVPVTAPMAALTASKLTELEPVAGFSATFLPTSLEPGAVLRQPELASTLERLASAGLDDFYRGDLADILAAGLEANGSPLRPDDLAGYRAKQVEPLSARVGEATVYNLPPPSQGVAALMIVWLAHRLAIIRPDGVAHVHAIVEATKRAFRLRNAELGDPLSMRVDSRAWLDEPFLDAEAQAIDLARAAPWPDPAAAGDTIWLGVTDASGLSVSYMQSVYWEYGSGLVVPGTGVLWQNRGAAFDLAPGPNQLTPGRRPRHTLCPALAAFDDGRLMVFGTMGGEGQPQTLAAVFSRYAWFERDLQQAVNAPRWLLGRTWGDETTTLKLERRFPAKVTDELRVLGHALELVDEFDDRMGHAGALVRHPTGVIEGATDPRADGAVAAR